MHTCAVTKHLVHAEASAEADVVGDLGLKLQSEAVGQQRVGIGRVSVPVNARNLLQVSHQRLLHLGRELSDGTFQAAEGQVPTEILILSVVLLHGLVDQAGELIGSVLPQHLWVKSHPQAALGRWSKHPQCLDRQILQLHAVIVSGDIAPDGMRFEAIVAAPLEAVAKAFPLGLQYAVVEVAHAGLQVGSRNRLLLLFGGLRRRCLRRFLLRVEPLFESVHGFLELIDLLP